MKLSTLLSCAIRVRFAPSPTGKLHLGGLRTVLINYLFAKSHPKGNFIVRIEDTDQNRIVPGAVSALFETLKWVGIEADESPISGGSFGPYTQSDRLDLYRNAADNLIQTGKAYRCFCSEDRLMLLRKHALQNRETPKYDGRCRNLSEEEIQEGLEKKLPYTVRFKLLDSPNSFQDLVFGQVEHNLADTEGDPIIIKSDRFPTYHLANVVDDHHMQISHVLRGQEWLVSTVKHMQLYSALEWSPPLFGHLPLLAHSSGKKLSKRDNAAFVEHYRDVGFEPISLINFVTRGGGGFPKRDFDEKILYSMEELSKMLDLAALKTHSVKVDTAWLNVYNKLALENAPKPVLVERITRLVGENFGPNHINSMKAKGFITDEVVERAVIYFVPRIETLNDFITKPDFNFLWNICEDTSDLAATFADSTRTVQVLKDVQDIVGGLDGNFKPASVTNAFRKYNESRKGNFKKLMHFVRKSLIGGNQGPPVGEMIEFLGKKVTVARLKHLEQMIHEQECLSSLAA